MGSRLGPPARPGMTGVGVSDYLEPYENPGPATSLKAEGDPNARAAHRRAEAPAVGSSRGRRRPGPGRRGPSPRHRAHRRRAPRAAIAAENVPGVRGVADHLTPWTPVPI